MLQTLLGPFLSGLIGAGLGAGGMLLAMHADVAVLKAELRGLAESVKGVKHEVDDAHKRIDDYLMPNARRRWNDQHPPQS